MVLPFDVLNDLGCLVSAGSASLDPELDLYKWNVNFFVMFYLIELPHSITAFYFLLRVNLIRRYLSHIHFNAVSDPVCNLL